MAIPLIYRTLTMLEAVLELPKVPTFLRDRYFPTDEKKDIFVTEEVIMDIKDGAQRMAPVVLPRKKAITVAREGYRTQRMIPPLVAPQRTLTLDDLESRGFGEALFSTMTAEDKEAAILGSDLQELSEMHDAREEFIAAKCMLNNGYILPQYADEYGTDEFIPYAIQFYEGTNNPGVYTPAVPWHESGADILGDITTMVRTLSAAGKPVKDLVCSPDVIDLILNDNKIYKLLENRRIELGIIDPKPLPDGAAMYATLNIAGRKIEIFSYEAQFIDDLTGAMAPVFDSGSCVLTAPGSGRGLYGAIKQLEQEDDSFHTYGTTRVPKYTSDAKSDIRDLRLASRPLFIPRYANPWISAKVTE